MGSSAEYSTTSAVTGAALASKRKPAFPSLDDMDAEDAEAVGSDADDEGVAGTVRSGLEGFGASLSGSSSAYDAARAYAQAKYPDRTVQMHRVVDAPGKTIVMDNGVEVPHSVLMHSVVDAPGKTVHMDNGTEVPHYVHMSSRVDAPASTKVTMSRHVDAPGPDQHALYAAMRPEAYQAARALGKVPELTATAIAGVQRDYETARAHVAAENIRKAYNMIPDASLQVAQAMMGATRRAAAAQQDAAAAQSILAPVAANALTAHPSAVPAHLNTHAERIHAAIQGAMGGASVNPADQPQSKPRGAVAEPGEGLRSR